MAVPQDRTTGSPSRKRKDLRLPALLLVIAAIAGIGWLVTLLPSQTDVTVNASDHEARRAAAFDALAVEPARSEVAETEAERASPTVRQHLADVRKLLSAGKYDAALERLNEVRQDVQHLPEALVLVGNAMLGKKDYRTAGDFFYAAVDRDPTLADGYFGLAVAAEGVGDLEMAIGGMRNFLHMQKDPDPYRLKVAQARAAIWEWESKLGRGEWGPTRGIPPGFTAAELKRDGRGAGTKVPIPGSENAQGISRYEIKYSDRIKMYPR